MDWRDIPDLGGLYQANSLGQIRSVTRHVPSKGGSTRQAPGKLISPATDGRYLMFRACVHGKATTVLVHRAVCAAFHGPPPAENMHAAHGDGNSLRNVPDNLRWATAKENCADRARHGTQVQGIRVNTNKLGESDVLEIRARLKQGEPTKVLAAAFGVHLSSIQQIMRGATWKHLLATA